MELRVAVASCECRFKISYYSLPSCSLFSPFPRTLLQCKTTVEPPFNEPLYNEVLGITCDILEPGPTYSKTYGTEPRYNENLVIKNTIRKPKRKMYPDIAGINNNTRQMIMRNRPTVMKNPESCIKRSTSQSAHYIYSMCLREMYYL